MALKLGSPNGRECVVAISSDRISLLTTDSTMNSSGRIRKWQKIKAKKFKLKSERMLSVHLENKTSVPTTTIANAEIDEHNDQRRWQQIRLSAREKYAIDVAAACLTHIAFQMPSRNKQFSGKRKSFVLDAALLTYCTPYACLRISHSHHSSREYDSKWGDIFNYSPSHIFPVNPVFRAKKWK